jgi:hypothetical protein
MTLSMSILGFSQILPGVQHQSPVGLKQYVCPRKHRMYVTVPRARGKNRKQMDNAAEYATQKHDSRSTGVTSGVDLPGDENFNVVEDGSKLIAAGQLTDRHSVLRMQSRSTIMGILIKIESQE